MRAYLIKNSSGIVKVSINGPCEIVVMSLSPRQPENYSTSFLKQDLQKLYGSAMGSISDSDEALNIFVTRFLKGRHRSSPSDQGSPQGMPISNSFSKLGSVKIERHSHLQTEGVKSSPKHDRKCLAPDILIFRFSVRAVYLSLAEG